VYGHQFYRASVEEKVKFLNDSIKKYHSLEGLLDDNFLDKEDVKAELARSGYYFVPELNRFVYCDNEQ
jgi:hypothetical protein